MLGRVGYQSPSVLRRTRRTIVLTALGVAIVALILGEVIDQVVNSYAAVHTRSLRTWESAVSALVAQENALVPTLSAVRTTATGKTRVQLDDELAALVSTSAQLSSTAAGLGIAPPSQAAKTRLLSVFDGREHAMRDLAGAVALATGPTHDRAGAAALLTVVGNQLEGSDRAYRSLVASLAHSGGAGSLAVSVLVPDPSQWTPAACSAFADGLARSVALAATSKLEIVAISLRPPPVKIDGLPVTTTVTTTSSTTTTTSTAFGARASATGTTGSVGATGTAGITGATGFVGVSGASGLVVTVPTTTSSTTTTTVVPPPVTSQVPPSGSISYLLPTQTLAVSVVVTNAGTVALRAISVVATLAARGANPHDVAPVVASARVADLAAGGAAFVSLAPLSVDPSVLRYGLSVTLSAQGAASTTDTLQLQTSS